MSDIWDVHPELAEMARSMMMASRLTIHPFHGYRPPDVAQRLWAEAEARHGALADQYIARPGHSNHERRVAIDFLFRDDAAYEWTQRNAHRYGLEAPMPWDPYHFEPIGLRQGVWKPDEFPVDRAAYTWQKGQPHPADRGAGSDEFASVLANVLRQPIPEQVPEVDLQPVGVQPAAVSHGTDQPEEVNDDDRSSDDAAGY